MCFITLALLAFLPMTAAAHGGRTDSNGGHRDSSTGEYHYHHGQPAHAHYDMNGDGKLDCPYDFVDITSSSSGKTTLSYSSSSSLSKSAYDEGYSDGHKKGYSDGKEQGYQSGFSAAKSEADKETKQLKEDHEKALKKAINETQSNTFWKTFWIIAALFSPIAILVSRGHRNELAYQKREHTKEVTSLMKAHSEAMSELSLNHEAEIKSLTAAKNVQVNKNDQTIRLMTSAHQKRVDDLQLEHQKLVDDLHRKHQKEVNSIISSYTGQLREHENEIEYWKRKYEKEKHNNLLYAISAGDDPDIQLPDDIRLRRAFTPVKGNVRENYPYGDYTVFVTRSGTRYHCSHKCARNAIPMHFFDVMHGSDPCQICVPKDMYPQPFPEWYVQIKKKLNNPSK